MNRSAGISVKLRPPEACLVATASLEKGLEAKACAAMGDAGVGLMTGGVSVLGAAFGFALGMADCCSGRAERVEEGLTIAEALPVGGRGTAGGRDEGGGELGGVVLVLELAINKVHSFLEISVCTAFGAAVPSVWVFFFDGTASAFFAF